MIHNREGYQKRTKYLLVLAQKKSPELSFFLAQHIITEATNPSKQIPAKPKRTPATIGDAFVAAYVRPALQFWVGGPYVMLENVKYGDGVVQNEAQFK